MQPGKTFMSSCSYMVSKLKVLIIRDRLRTGNSGFSGIISKCMAVFNDRELVCVKITIGISILESVFNRDEPLCDKSSLGSSFLGISSFETDGKDVKPLPGKNSFNSRLSWIFEFSDEPVGFLKIGSSSL